MRKLILILFFLIPLYSEVDDIIISEIYDSLDLEFLVPENDTLGISEALNTLPFFNSKIIVNEYKLSLSDHVIKSLIKNYLITNNLLIKIDIDVILEEEKEDLIEFIKIQTNYKGD